MLWWHILVLNAIYLLWYIVWVQKVINLVWFSFSGAFSSYDFATQQKSHPSKWPKFPCCDSWALVNYCYIEKALYTFPSFLPGPCTWTARTVRSGLTAWRSSCSWSKLLLGFHSGRNVVPLAVDKRRSWRLVSASMTMMMTLLMKMLMSTLSTAATVEVFDIKWLSSMTRTIVLLSVLIALQRTSIPGLHESGALTSITLPWWQQSLVHQLHDIVNHKNV